MSSDNCPGAKDVGAVTAVLPRVLHNRGMTHYRPARAGCLLVGVLALVVAGCGGSPKSAVASLGHPKTTTTVQSGAAPGPGSAKGYSQMVSYSQCMRAHGVPNFPDPSAGPDGGYGFKITPADNLDPNSSAFKSAQEVCRKLLPNGGVPTPAEQAQAMAQALKMTQCMRSHGYPDFPDPVSEPGGGIGIQLKEGSGMNPNSPKFQAAQKACQKLVPGGP